MDDVTDSAHDRPEALALPGGVPTVLKPCRLSLVGKRPDLHAPLNDVAGPSHGAVRTLPGAKRIYAAVHDTGAVAVVAAGPIEAIEQPEVSAAPVGSMLLTDETEDRGRLVAERTLHGWRLVLGDGGRRS